LPVIAGFGGMLGLILLATLLIGSILVRRKTPRKGIAVFGLAIAIATMPNSCPPPKFTNAFVFYMTSPNTAVLIQASSFSSTPTVSFVGQ
jgi:hypothetical protein